MGSSISLSCAHGAADECPDTITRERQTPGELFLVAGLVGPSAALFLALAASRLTVAQYILLHVGSCAMGTALGLCWIWWRDPDEHAGSRSTVLLHAMAGVLLAGPFGAAVAAVLLVPRAAATGGGEGVLAPDPVGDPEVMRLEELHNSLLDRRLRFAQAHAIRPLLDVMIDGTPTEKLEALRVMARRYVPELAPAIRLALEDKDAAVRVFAATVIAHQNNLHTKRIGALRIIAQGTPECSDHWRELAQAHADYAASGLLETSRAEAEARQAQAYRARAAQVLPATPLV